MLVNWHEDLNNPQKPTTVRVDGLGDVEVKAGDIEEANKLNGDVEVEIVETTTFGGGPRQFILGYFHCK